MLISLNQSFIIYTYLYNLYVYPIFFIKNLIYNNSIILFFHNGKLMLIFNNCKDFDIFKLIVNIILWTRGPYTICGENVRLDQIGK